MNQFLSLTTPHPKGFSLADASSILEQADTPNALFANSLKHVKSKLKENFSLYKGLILSPGSEYQLTKIHLNCWHLEVPDDLREASLNLATSHLQIISNKKALQNKHNKHQRRFELFSNVAKEGLLFHKNGVITDVNQALMKMFDETDREAILGKNILEFTVPEERERVIQKLTESTNYTYETTCNTRSGKVIPVRITGFNHQINGETFRVASIHNISDLKKAESELQISNERLSLIAQSTGAGHYDWSFPNGKLYWNSTMHKLFGLDENSKKERNLHFNEVVHPDDQKRLEESFLTSLDPKSNQTIFTTEFRIIPEKNVVKHIEVLSIHKRHSNGHVRRIIGVCTDITARKMAEQSLKDSEAMLKLVINAIPQNLYWKDVNSVYMGCNKNFSKALKLSHPSKIKGMTDFEISPDPKAAQRFIEWDKQIMKSGKPDFHQLVHEKNNSGSKSWIDISKTPIKNHQGEIIGTLGTFEDVTKRVEAESQIHKLTRAIDQSINGIAITNLDGIVEYANSKLGNLLGVPPHKLVSTKYSIFNSNNFTNPDQVKQQVLNGNDWKGEIQLETQNGQEVWINSSLSPIKDINGKTTHFLSVQNDISKQHQIRTELEASEAKYRKMLEQLPVAIIEFDLELNIYYANSMALQLYGINSEDSLKINVLQLIDTTDQIKVKSDILNKLFANDDTPVEYLGINKKGKKVPVLVYTNLIYKNQQIVGIRGAVVDITERKQAEKEAIEQNFKLESATQTLQRTNIELNQALIKAQRSKELEKALAKIKETQSKLVQAEKMATVGVLSAGIAHEINNPLNFIKGGNYAITEYIEEHITDSETQQELLEMTQMIDEGVDRTSKIVNSLNRFSRDSKVTHEIFDFHDVIENCLTILHNQLKFKVNITKKFDSNPAKFKGNEGELHQVILNILHNSVQAISKKGKIDIFTRVSTDTIFIQVSDNGYGIKSEHLKSITDPFFTTKAPGAGTGLGMSISYNIINKHGGTISYQSPDEKGCIVELVFKT